MSSIGDAYVQKQKRERINSLKQTILESLSKGPMSEVQLRQPKDTSKEDSEYLLAMGELMMYDNKIIIEEQDYGCHKYKHTY